MADSETEYKEVCNNLRFYGDLRFKQLTVFLTLTGALLAWAAGKSMDNFFMWSIPILGLAATFLFYAIETSSTRYWDSFWRRAKSLESSLDFQQYQQLIRGTSVANSAVKATRYLYLLVAFIWLILLLRAVIAA
jgi:hypothetical protein